MDVEKAEEVVKACDELIEELKDELAKRREKIQEGIKGHLLLCFKAKGVWGTFYENFADSFSKSLPIILDGMGCVLKVERELPEVTEELEKRAHCGQFNDHGWYYAGQGSALKAGYEATAPLIEEKDADTAE